MLLDVLLRDLESVENFVFNKSILILVIDFEKL